MLKMSPSARLRVATSSISVSLSATTFSRTTSSTGAPLSSTTTWAPATPARSSMMSWRKPRRRVTVPTRPTFASGFSTASSVTRSVSATGRPLTSCFSSAYSSCVTLPRRHSRSQVAGGRLRRVRGGTPRATDQQQSDDRPVLHRHSLYAWYTVLPPTTVRTILMSLIFSGSTVCGSSDEHDEVGQLAGGDRSLERFFVRRICAVERVDAGWPRRRVIRWFAPHVLPSHPLRVTMP